MFRFAALLLLLLTQASAALAQTAQPQAPNGYKIGNEGDTITAGPDGAEIQIGAGLGWTPVVRVPKDRYPLTTSYNQTTPSMPEFGPDPIYGTLKEVDATETCSPQTFTVGLATVTVPALPAAQCAPPPPPPATTPPPPPTPAPTPPAPTPAKTDATWNDAAILISTGPQQSLTLDETAKFAAAVAHAKDLLAQAEAAKTAVLQLEQQIVTAHGLDATKPFQIVFDSSLTISYAPPTSATAPTQ